MKVLHDQRRVIGFLLIFFATQTTVAMGLRSFVALPLEQGGTVFRLQDTDSLNVNSNTAIAELAYGIRGKHTLFFGIPYRISPGGNNRFGDVSVLYRYTAWQKDFTDGTYRFGLLGGGFVPTNNTSNGGAQGGAVATFYQDRHELDLDTLYGQGFGKSLNRAQYDVSYQYRLSPSQLGNGFTAWWNAVVEYNGRWKQNQKLTHQATIGLQWVHAAWVLEGGVIQELNNKHDTQLIVSMRIHI